jgi:hypothetical protein
MKERRSSGATHSFRLTQRAAEIVDGISYPRKHGGKSRKVSEAITWYFTSPLMNHEGKMPASHGMPYPHEIIEMNQIHVKTIQSLRDRIENLESEANTPPLWRRFVSRFR